MSKKPISGLRKRIDKKKIDKKQQKTNVKKKEQEGGGGKFVPLEEMSKETLQRAEIYKEFIRNKSIEYFYYLYTREKRLEGLKQNLKKVKISKNERSKAIKEHFKKESNFLRRRRTKMTVKQFSILAKIGQGGYGDVFLCRKSDTNELVALKRMKKALIEKTNKVEHIMSERQVLAEHSSPWLVQLLYSFQDSKYIYLAMEFVRGGDLKALLMNIDYLDENTTKFYAAEMLLAIQDLHELGYIHRDLKPENFLINHDGHVKLTDFGLSKKFIVKKEWRDTVKRIHKKKQKKKNSKKNISNNTLSKRQLQQKRRNKFFTVVGSPEYISPEILEKKGYTKTVDFWSFGCILYEMLTGFPPFSGSSIEETLENVIDFKSSLENPLDDETDEEIIQPQAWNLIRKLINKPNKRLGKNGIQEIKNHPFFEGIEWNNFQNSTPPFVPKVESDLDISYFDTSYFDENEIDLEEPESLNLSERNNQFAGFTFKKYNLKQGGTQDIYQKK
ncbi:cell cycle protein kinase dbf2-related [Anaeramoeba flamelloides]|uniref:non-specific serine/threonine protein kinase n=1 Tax=Anaeramoeba flamelloides TaxID=1746091 RepID=A0AAV7ZI95_9EUKA|nr:cell cycle protein kinase dbf2-related [Anaeramoeba flamelloides]KAJ6243391.1 cell cycle protein kinase dbf2-related [Anaeramoeba flamelloides]